MAARKRAGTPRPPRNSLTDAAASAGGGRKRSAPLAGTATKQLVATALRPHPSLHPRSPCGAPAARFLAGLHLRRALLHPLHPVAACLLCSAGLLRAVLLAAVPAAG